MPARRLTHPEPNSPVYNYNAPETTWGPGLPQKDHTDNSSSSSSSSSGGGSKTGQVPGSGADPAIQVSDSGKNQPDTANDDAPGARHRDSDTSAMAFMEALADGVYPSQPFMEQPHVKGQLYPAITAAAGSGSGGYQFFSSSHLFHVSQTFSPTALSEKVEIDFFSPNKDANVSEILQTRERYARQNFGQRGLLDSRPGDR